MLLLETVPVTVAGLAGFVPYTNRSAIRLISSRRQRQSDLVEMRVPSILRNGSGSRELLVVELGTVTAQSAPSFSEPAEAASAGVLTLRTVTAPTSVSAETVSATTVERILERPELMITRAPSNCGWTRHQQSMIADVGSL
ncbi:hypothetical protein GCM10009681_23010 [Luedemannella helvata]|uniref:Secreted protein n=1 Tax=Luedemannella helvata TaxID=349315 RepID=A0ABP4WF35_9ACTN